MVNDESMLSNPLSDEGEAGEAEDEMGDEDDSFTNDFLQLAYTDHKL